MFRTSIPMRAAAFCLLSLLAGCASSTPEAAGQVNDLPAMMRGPFSFGPYGVGPPAYQPYDDLGGNRP